MRHGADINRRDRVRACSLLWERSGGSSLPANRLCFLGSDPREQPPGPGQRGARAPALPAAPPGPWGRRQCGRQARWVPRGQAGRLVLPVCGPRCICRRLGECSGPTPAPRRLREDRTSHVCAQLLRELSSCWERPSQGSGSIPGPEQSHLGPSALTCVAGKRSPSALAERSACSRLVSDPSVCLPPPPLALLREDCSAPRSGQQRRRADPHHREHPAAAGGR